MGRLYKTSSANTLDYMYKMPQQLMLGALQNTEAQIDNIYQQSDLLNNALTKVKYLTPDEQRVKEISQGYANEVDNITKAITQNPMEWRKYMPTIKDLGRKMNNDFTTGELGKIQGNYNACLLYTSPSPRD